MRKIIYISLVIMLVGISLASNKYVIIIEKIGNICYNLAIVK